ncbi:hypothetical protein AZA_22227 [Nitrospirillum viridazoti Y2]|nr:hypothetical protein AZA_22227 [Nitrospirillum amazonense Y2]
MRSSRASWSKRRMTSSQSTTWAPGRGGSSSPAAHSGPRVRPSGVRRTGRRPRYRLGAKRRLTANSARQKCRRRSTVE